LHLQKNRCKDITNRKGVREFGRMRKHPTKSICLVFNPKEQVKILFGKRKQKVGGSSPSGGLVPDCSRATPKIERE